MWFPNHATPINSIQVSKDGFSPKLCLIRQTFVIVFRSPTTHAKKSTQFMDRDKVKFNFDEFYKAHYGEALKRQRESKRKQQEDKINSTFYQMPKLAQQMLIVGVSLSVLVIGLISLPQPPVQALKRH